MNALGLLAQIPPGTLDLNRAIPDTVHGGYHPHLVDFYIPNATITRALVMLHGGSGSKENFSLNLALTFALPVTLGNVNWAPPTVFQVLVVIPQGQACTGVTNAWNPGGVDTRSSNHPGGVATWTNHVTWSQADDVAFLQDLKTYIVATYGAIGCNLCGHSNGGGMTNRMWYESPNTFSHYCCVSGPASDYFLAHPTLPSPVKPFFQQIGLLDSVLDVSGGPVGPGSHFYDPTWCQNPAQLSVDDVAFPALSHWIGEWDQTATRVAAYDGTFTDPSDGVVTAAKIGTQTTWTYSGGNIVLQLLSNANHNLVTHEQSSGRRIFNDWMQFIRST